MTHDITAGCTTYVVVSGVHIARKAEIKERLSAVFESPQPADVHNPFMLHSLIVHETFLDAKSVITPLRYQLYDQLDRVDVYAAKSPQERGKSELEDLTIQLHVVSQELDSLTASADMTSMIVRRLSNAHERYQGSIADPLLKNGIVKTTDALRYLLESVESQKRWLASYKARKDIAMTLVSPK